MRKILGIAGLFGTLAACATVGDGDYVVYRVGYGETQASDGCFGEDGQDIDQAEDESSFLPTESFALYRVGDNYYMDFGEFSLVGTKTGDQFNFSGEDLDVDFFGGENGDANRTEDVDELNVRFTVNGRAISGTYESTSSFTCTGPDCFEGDNFTCTGSSPFFGSEVRDVELQWDIER